MVSRNLSNAVQGLAGDSVTNNRAELTWKVWPFASVAVSLASWLSELVCACLHHQHPQRCSSPNQLPRKVVCYWTDSQLAFVI